MGRIKITMKKNKNDLSSTFKWKAWTNRAREPESLKTRTKTKDGSNYDDYVCLNRKKIEKSKKDIKKWWWITLHDVLRILKPVRIWKLFPCRFEISKPEIRERWK